MSSILTFFIALIFIFALLSLITQSIVEVVISWLKMRANFLKETITGILNDVMLNKNFAEILYNHPQIDLTKKDYKSVPSYISSTNFSQTLIDIMCREYEHANIRFVKDEGGCTHVVSNVVIKDTFGQFKAGVESLNYSDLKVLLMAFTKRSPDLPALQKNIEEWYEELMNRATGWFKDKLQKILWIVSLAFVIAINANLFSIVDDLWKNQELSGRVSAMAEVYMANHPDAGKVADSSFAAIRADVDSLRSTGLPLGWEKVQNKIASGAPPPICDFASWTGFKQSWGGMLLGWILMALFLTAGAPFWFQLLSRVISLRKTGIKPKTAAKSKK